MEYVVQPAEKKFESKPQITIHKLWLFISVICNFYRIHHIFQATKYLNITQWCMFSLFFLCQWLGYIQQHKTELIYKLSH